MTYRWKQKPNKFGAIKTEVDGVTFMSKGEATRYLYLKLRQKAGEIRDLELQPCYSIEINGKHICKYFGDFRYIDVSTGKQVIEDYKSPITVTPVYKLKKKLLFACHGIEITEV